LQTIGGSSGCRREKGGVDKKTADYSVESLGATTAQCENVCKI